VTTSDEEKVRSTDEGTFRDRIVLATQLIGKSIVGDIWSIGAVIAATVAVGGIVDWLAKRRKPGSGSQRSSARRRKPQQ
jgi:hypothetical protein